MRSMHPVYALGLLAPASGMAFIHAYMKELLSACSLDQLVIYLLMTVRLGQQKQVIYKLGGIVIDDLIAS
jgi:hypothetical protein